MILADEDIARVAYAAGFRGTALEVAIATSLAESGGNATINGDVGLQNSTWGPSVGLWQIRSLNAQHGTGQARDASKLTDPLENARSAYEISQGGTNFGPWTTFRTGAYRKSLGRARMAIAALGPDIATMGPLSGAPQQLGPDPESIREMYRQFRGREPSDGELARVLSLTGGEAEQQIGAGSEAQNYTAARAGNALTNSIQAQKTSVDEFHQRVA